VERLGVAVERLASAEEVQVAQQVGHDEPHEGKAGEAGQQFLADRRPELESRRTHEQHFL